MPKPGQERRRSARLLRDFVVKVRAKDGVEHKCAVRDISAGGVFFYCSVQFAEHFPIDLMLQLPPEITCGETTQWVCVHATVVRVEPDPSGGHQHGIAAKIERLEIMPELHA